MHDLTRALTAGHPNWPGDTPFRLELTADMTQGSSVNIMQITTSTHSGTHLDAPFHYGGEKLGSVDLEMLLGPAQVIDARAGVFTGLLEPFPTLPARVLWEALLQAAHDPAEPGLAGQRAQALPDQLRRLPRRAGRSNSGSSAELPAVREFLNHQHSHGFPVRRWRSAHCRGSARPGSPFPGRF